MLNAAASYEATTHGSGAKHVSSALKTAIDTMRSAT